nr:chaperone protein ClpC1, chloroplastic-like [Spinacia oleracea]
MPSPKFVWKNFELLSKYGTDLTHKAEKGELDPAIWREREIEHVMQILCKRRKNNPCILGSPGIGLTSIVEGLAQRIVNGLVPPQFLGKKVVGIKKKDMFAGCEEQRLIALIDEMKQTEGMVILFVDELNLLTLFGDKIDQSHLLRRPSKCWKVLQLQYGEHHNVDYSDEALVAVARLSSQCHRLKLEKAIDMIDEAGARVSLEKTKTSRNKRVVTKQDITDPHMMESKHVGLSEGNSLIRRVGTQLGKSRALLDMMESLRKHIIGQEEAIEALSCALLRARVGITDRRRPIASFIFTGPTGVGKTALANAIAIEYFGSMRHVIKLDMSEYKESHSVSKLFGSPPGYTGCGDGGQLTKAVERQPESVIIFDEVEKAHADVFNSLLQVLEDGTYFD